MTQDEIKFYLASGIFLLLGVLYGTDPVMWIVSAMTLLCCQFYLEDLEEEEVA